MALGEPLTQDSSILLQVCDRYAFDTDGNRCWIHDVDDVDPGELTAENTYTTYVRADNTECEITTIRKLFRFSFKSSKFENDAYLEQREIWY